MPELPEVETVRRGLEERIVGLKINAVEVLCEKSFVGKVNEVVGCKVEGLRRFGKALIIDLSENISLMVHLRMTGQLIFDGVGNAGTENGRGAGDVEKNENRRNAKAENGRGTRDAERIKNGRNASSAKEGRVSEKLLAQNEKGEERFAAGHPSENFVATLPNKQTRVVIRFDRGTLYFNDQRKFGFIKVLKTDAVEQDDFVARLAKEPWQMGEGEFYEKLQRHKGAPIKAVILDQAVIAGLGNIYADEALFAARIHPARRAGTVTREEAAALLAAAREVMEKSIEAGGSTMATYVRADGTRGNYLEQFAQVFRREGLACPRCGAEIEKIRVAGRGTHICPQCQVLEAERD